MYYRRSIWILFLLLIFGCQSPMKGQSEFDSKAPFRQYKCFAWITEEPLIKPIEGFIATDPSLSPIVERFLRAAVERNLADKGFERVMDPESADLVVSFALGTSDKIKVDSYPAQNGYGYGVAYSNWVSEARSYTAGALTIEFFDQRTKNLVWRGWTERALSSGGYASTSERYEIVNEAVDAILAEFPPQSLR